MSRSFDVDRIREAADAESAGSRTPGGSTHSSGPTDDPASRTDDDLIRFPTGSLTSVELASAFWAFPADVTFIDSEGAVRYYSQYRIFTRPPECLGRDVLECHPSSTRAGVARLVGELRDGWRDEALFLTEKDGRPVSVRYLAVRDRDGAYLGCLEVARWADEAEGFVGADDNADVEPAAADQSERLSAD